MNLTFANKVQIGNFIQIGIDFDFVPLLLELQTDFYSSSMLNDNCIMWSGMTKVMKMDVKLT